MKSSPSQRLKDRLATLPLRVGSKLPPNLRRLINLARGIEAPALVPRLPGRRVAVLAPHPDDELIGCGGTLCKHLQAGEEVFILFLTSGERTAGLAGLPQSGRGSVREKEAVAALSHLGVAPENLVFLRYPDGEVSGKQGEQSLQEVLAALAPDLVYAPYPVDAHTDHVATTALLGSCLESLPPSARIALYEVWTPLYPNIVVDISAQLPVKMEALAHYKSALQSVDYLHTVQGLAAYRSAQGLSGSGYAEAFCLVDLAGFAQLMKEVNR